MEEQLIVAVSRYPVLYDCTQKFYKDFNLKRDAWVHVSKTVGISPEKCKKKWKNLRDSYRREVMKKKEKSRGGPVVTQRPWRFSAIMGFLNPFLELRPACGNLEGFNPEADQPDGGTGTVSPLEVEDEHPVPTISPSPLAFSSSNLSLPPTVSSTGQQAKRLREDPLEKRLLETIERTAKEDPDELFFRSLLPMIRPLKMRRKEELKMAIHQLVLEAHCRQEEEEEEEEDSVLTAQTLVQSGEQPTGS